MRTYSVFLLMLVGSCAGGSDCGLTDPQSCAAVRTTASLVEGNWRALNPVGGLSLTLQLMSNDTTVVGTGSLISGGAGTSADVRGFVTWRDAASTPEGLAPAHPMVVLDLALADGRTARLDQGTLRGDTLDAALTFDAHPTSTYSLSLVRESAH